MRRVATSLLLGVIGLAVGAALLYSGTYDIGADAPHTEFVYWLAKTLRNRSVEVRAADIAVPPLDDSKMISVGAGQYSSVCSNCHLAPGFASSEIREGLYPRPPALSSQAFPASEIFWSVKHGIKMSGMPAWGRSHDDQEIWAIVAFVRRLPGMTATEYKTIVASAPPDDDMVQMPMPGAQQMGTKQFGGSPPSAPKRETR